MKFDQNDKVVFISYDGKFPNLCSGTLRFKIGEHEFAWKYCLESGGRAPLDDETEYGEWAVSFKKIPGLVGGIPKKIRQKIVEMVNDNIGYGCCGGCR